MMNKDEGGIRSVAKALQILEAFDGEHRTLRVTDLARGLGLPKSTVHGLLRTLGARGFVRQVEGGRAYGPGPALLRLATMVDREVLLVEAARGPLRELARGTEETAKLGVRVGLSVVVLEAVESPRVLHTRGDVGVVAPLYCTALGKAVLAFLPEEERERIVGALTLRAYTPRTVGGREALRRELERIRVRGYATDVQEHEGDVRCVGAPVRDGRGYPVGAVSVSGPAQRMPLRRLGELGPRVVEVAEAIGRRLGGREEEGGRRGGGGGGGRGGGGGGGHSAGGEAVGGGGGRGGGGAAGGGGVPAERGG